MKYIHPSLYHGPINVCICTLLTADE